MAHYLDLFSPATYEAFPRSVRTVSGFRIRQQKTANRIKVGDKPIRPPCSTSSRSTTMRRP